MSKVVVLQHSAYETLGSMSTALRARGIEYRYVGSFKGHPVPKEMGDATGLILLGGPMGVYEQGKHPYLADEIRLIEKALYQDRPVLGICLGSQLLASALGADVRKGERPEIGWGGVNLTPAGSRSHLLGGVPNSFMGFHWHGDIFQLPKGAVALASSNPTEHQAFRYGEMAYGFLFHMEVTRQIIRAMVAAFEDEIMEAGGSSVDIIRGIGPHLPILQQSVGGPVLARWAGLLADASMSSAVRQNICSR